MKKEKIIILVLLLIIIIPLILFYLLKKEENINYNFKIYFFNAGKADSILLEKNNKYILIDTGESSLSDDILKYFKENNITKLEYLIITHFDKDHVGSASTIIDNIEIGEVLQSNSPKESEYYTNYLNSLSNKNITPKTVEENYKLNFEDLEIIVNGPDKVYDKNESNNSSLIVSVTNGNNKFLFMGDAENARIKDFISTNNEIYDFIKIPYHGNYLKRLDDLLDDTKSSYGVMTCSQTEGCETDTLKVLNDYNIKYYMTKNGPVSVYSDGNKITIKQ